MVVVKSCSVVLCCVLRIDDVELRWRNDDARGLLAWQSYRRVRGNALILAIVLPGVIHIAGSLMRAFVVGRLLVGVRHFFFESDGVCEIFGDFV